MRRRMLLATILAVAVAVLLLGLPLAFFGATYVRDTEHQRLTDRLDRLATSVQTAQERGYDISQTSVERAVRGRVGDPVAFVQVILPNGQEVTGGAPITGPVTKVQALTAPPAGIQPAAVFLTVSSWSTWIKGAQLVTLVAAVAVVAVGAGVTIAVWQANRLSAPLVYLAASAEQLGSGQVRPQMDPSGVEEIDLVATEIKRSADRLAARLAAERQFTSDARHQMRTPLAALSLRLEEIQLTAAEPEIQEEARISLEQVERLVGVVDDLLAASRQSSTAGTAQVVNLNDIARQQMEEWGPSFEREDRALFFDLPEDAEVYATPGQLSQIIATLIENSLRHGGGVTTVSTRGAGSGGSVTIEVTDEGPGVVDDIADRIFERGVSTGGTGLGLALARDLAAADGGRLTLAKRRPPVFALFLPVVPKATELGGVLPEGSNVGVIGEAVRRKWDGGPG